MGRRRTVLGVVATAGLVAGVGMAGAAPLEERQKLTVGGWLPWSDGGRVYVAGELPCPVEGESGGVDNPNLRVKTAEGVFHLSSAQTECSGEGGAAGGQLSGTGLGTMNGELTQISFTFYDAGDQHELSENSDGALLEFGFRGGRAAGGPLEQGSIRMGKTFNHVEVAARR